MMEMILLVSSRHVHTYDNLPCIEIDNLFAVKGHRLAWRLALENRGQFCILSSMCSLGWMEAQM